MMQVAAGIVRRGAQVLVARRGAEGAHAGLWEFPGGKIEPGETPEGCLQRELREELGIEVRVGRLAGKARDGSGESEIELLFYEADFVSGAPRLTDHDVVAWVAPGEIPAFNLTPGDREFVESWLRAGAKESP